MTPADPLALVAAARAHLDHAHAPYSLFPVAAAVVDERGRVFLGVNVENASYGLTMCAERVAIFSAVAAGAKRIAAMAVTARRMSAITPCGACRQVMAEFCAADTPVYSDQGGTSYATWTAGELLPRAFEGSALGSAATPDEPSPR